MELHSVEAAVCIKALKGLEEIRVDKRCEARARKGTGEGTCDRPLDKHGNCDRASSHIDIG